MPSEGFSDPFTSGSGDGYMLFEAYLDCYEDQFK